MTKISINLLPAEMLVEKTKNTNFYKIQFLGVSVILVLIFLTSLTLALQILQNRNITTAQAKLKDSEERASGLVDTQTSLFILKNRLNVIGQYLGISSKQSSIYALLNKLIPSQATINAISVDKSGSAIILALLSDRENLELLLNNLADKEKNEDKFSEVGIDSLNRGKDGIFRISLKIKPKQ